MLARNSFPGDPNRAAGNPQHAQAEWNKILASQRNQNQKSNTAERNLRLQRAANARAANWARQGHSQSFAQTSQQRTQAMPQSRSFAQATQRQPARVQTQVRSRGR